jgi:hypothetical protein
MNLSKIFTKQLQSSLSIVLLLNVMSWIFVYQAEGQEIAVPIRTQMSLFKTLLTFERNHTRDNKGNIRIAVVYQNKFRKSLAASEEIRLYINEKNLTNDFSVQMIDIDIEGIDLEATISQTQSTVILVCPLRSISISSIIDISRRKKMLTMSIVAEYVNKGISVGIDLNEDKPLILINRISTKMENADFDSRLLHVAKIIDSVNP